jgi:hypothetical protein
MTHERVRVLVLPMLRLSRELLEGALRMQSGVELVECPAARVPRDGAELRRLCEESGAQFVVAGLEGWELPAACAELLQEQTRQVRVIAVEPTVGEAFLYEHRPHQVTLGPVTPDEVVETIRAAAAAPSRNGGA